MSDDEKTIYLVNSVLDYVKNKTANFALMINGDWGSGKTYFWNNVIRPKIEDSKYDETSEKKVKTIYISLYGIKNIEEINKKLSYELYASLLPNKKAREAVNGNVMPEIAKAIFSVGGEITKQLSNKFLGIDIDKTVEATVTLSDTITNLREGYVFCFDDLERTDISMTEILGYLNNFVEHDNTKVIIICNEDEISKRTSNENKELKVLASSFLLDKENKFSRNGTKKNKNDKTNLELIEEYNNQLYSQSNEYKTIKEKLVGKTLKYSSDISDVINSIIDNIGDQKLKNDLTNNKDLILTILSKSGKGNIRIIKQAINDYEIINKKIINKYPSLSFDEHKVVFVFLLAYSIELKTNQKGFHKFKEIKDRVHFEQELLMREMFGEEEKEVFRNFKSKYFRDLGLYYDVFYKFVEIYVREGILNEEIFEKEINYMISKKVGKQPIYEIIINENYFKLTNEEFRNGIEETYELIKSGEMPYYRYYYAYTMFKRFVSYGLFNIEDATMFNDFLCGLKKTIDKSPTLNTLQSDDLSRRLREMKDEGEDQEQYAAIRNEIISVNELIREKSIKRKSEELFLTINSDLKVFIGKLYNEYSQIPVFKYCEINKLADLIFSLSNEEIANFRNTILSRYEDTYIDTLQEDFENLRKLSQFIESFIENKEIQLNIHMLSILNDAIKVSLQKKAILKI